MLNNFNLNGKWIKQENVSKKIESIILLGGTRTTDEKVVVFYQYFEKNNWPKANFKILLMRIKDSEWINVRRHHNSPL